MDQTALFSSTQETRNTHTLDMPYFADNPCSFQQQPMEAPNHNMLSNNFVWQMPVQSSNTGYLQQIMP